MRKWMVKLKIFKRVYVLLDTYTFNNKNKFLDKYRILLDDK